MDAALSIGLDKANVRNVADALKMSVPGLYHYVRTREDLIDLVVEASFARLVEQAAEAESFREALLHAARGLFDLITKHPPIVANLASGSSVVTGKVVERLGRLISLGVQSGFQPMQSYEIFTRLISCVVGAAVVNAGDLAMRRGDGPFLAKVRRVMVNQEDQDSPLRELADQARAQSPFNHFDTVVVMLDGLAIVFGPALRSSPGHDFGPLVT